MYSSRSGTLQCLFIQHLSKHMTAASTLPKLLYIKLGLSTDDFPSVGVLIKLCNLGIILVTSLLCNANVATEVIYYSLRNI